MPKICLGWFSCEFVKLVTFMHRQERLLSHSNLVTFVAHIVGCFFFILSICAAWTIKQQSMTNYDDSFV